MKDLTDLGLSDTDDQQIYRGDLDMNDAVVAGDGEYKWVGKRTVRPDGVDKVTGRAAYGADYNMAGMLYVY